MAQFIALMERNHDDFAEADFLPLLDAEAEQVRVLYASGSLRAAWGRKDVPGAVLLLEASSLDEAHAVCATLPLAQKGMLKATYVEVGPYRGFGPRG